LEGSLALVAISYWCRIFGIDWYRLVIDIVFGIFKEDKDTIWSGSY